MEDMTGIVNTANESKKVSAAAGCKGCVCSCRCSGAAYWVGRFLTFSGMRSAYAVF